MSFRKVFYVQLYDLWLVGFKLIQEPNCCQNRVIDLGS